MSRNNKSRIGLAMGYRSAHVGTPPCEGCKTRQQCKDNKLACTDFDGYVATNRLLNKDRAPSAARYAQIFRGKDLLPGHRAIVAEELL